MESACLAPVLHASFPNSAKSPLLAAATRRGPSLTSVKQNTTPQGLATASLQRLMTMQHPAWSPSSLAHLPALKCPSPMETAHQASAVTRSRVPPSNPFAFSPAAATGSFAAGAVSAFSSYSQQLLLPSRHVYTHSESGALQPASAAQVPHVPLPTVGSLSSVCSVSDLRWQSFSFSDATSRLSSTLLTP